MLKNLEQIFQSEEKIREKLDKRQRIKDQTNLQEKSLKIALKELQEELLLSQNTNPSTYVKGKYPDNIKNSINKKHRINKLLE